MSFRRAKINHQQHQQQHVLSLPAPVSVGMSCASSGPPSPLKTLPAGVWKREESYIQETPQTQLLEEEGSPTRQTSALGDPARPLRAASVRYDADVRVSRSNSAAWRYRAASSPRTGSASRAAASAKPLQVSAVDLVVHGWNGRLPPGRALPPVRREEAPKRATNHSSFRPRTPSAGPGSGSASGPGSGNENKHERVAIGGVINPGGQVPCIWLEKPKTNLVDLDEFPFYEMRVRQPTLTKVYTPKALGSFDVMQALSGRPTALEAELRYYYEAFKRHDMSNLPRIKCRTLPASRSFTFTN